MFKPSKSAQHITAVYQQKPPQAVPQHKLRTYSADVKYCCIYGLSASTIEECPIMSPEGRTAVTKQKQSNMA